MNDSGRFGFDTEEASEAVEHLFRTICTQTDIRYYPPSKRENTKIIDALTGNMNTAFIHLGKRVPVVQPRGQKEERTERMKDFMIVDKKQLKKINPSAEGATLILFMAGIVRAVYSRLNELQGESEK